MERFRSSQGGFRRLRAATYFAHGGKVGKTPPGTAQDERFALIFALPRTPFTGAPPEKFSRSSGAQNLSGWSEFPPGHWALSLQKLGPGAVPQLRLALPSQRFRCESWRAGLGPAPTKA